MEKPIIFSTPMVRAILDGRKTQTRRIIKPQPIEHNHSAYIEADWKNEKPEYVMSHDGENQWFCKYCGEGILLDGDSIYKCPYGKVSDILWVRETWRDNGFGMWVYKADDIKLTGPWTPSIYMHKYACRLRLKITNVRVERLKDISEEDAIAEGIEMVQHPSFYKNYLSKTGASFYSSTSSYESLWEKINGKGSWALNPWVWVIKFKRL